MCGIRYYRPKGVKWGNSNYVKGLRNYSDIKFEIGDEVYKQQTEIMPRII